MYWLFKDTAGCSWLDWQKQQKHFIFLQKGNIDKIVIISEHNCGELKVFCCGVFFADALH